MFPHEGKLVTVDQLNFTQKGRMESNESTMPLVDQVKPAAQSLGARMDAPMMGTFDLLAQVLLVWESPLLWLLIGLILGFSLPTMNLK